MSYSSATSHFTLFPVEVYLASQRMAAPVWWAMELYNPANFKNKPLMLVMAR